MPRLQISPSFLVAATHANLMLTSITMKLKIVLILSLAANLLLGLYIVRHATTRELRSEPGRVVETNQADTRQSPTRAAADVMASPTNTTPARTFNWEWVESPDYREYIANLRAIGCPEETIRDIIVADVNKLYAVKKREARGEPREFEYWKAGNPWMAQLDSNYLANSRALEEEKLSVLRQLGIEPDAKMQMNSFIDPMDALDTMFGFLPEDKQISVMKIMQDMQTEMMEAAGDGGGVDPEAMQETQRKMEEAIRAVLTPEEFRDYELRMSMTANSMRSQLAGWDPDEQEFLKVYELRKAFDDEFSLFSRGNENEAERTQRQEAEQQMNEAIKKVLGEDRYEDYTRAQDWNFQQIRQAARRADLGTEEAIKVYDMRQVAEEEARNVRNNRDLTEEQRIAALEGIQAETERSIKKVLGDEGWDQYNRGFNTQWLKNMAPEPSPVEAEE